MLVGMLRESPICSLRRQTRSCPGSIRHNAATCGSSLGIWEPGRGGRADRQTGLGCPGPTCGWYHHRDALGFRLVGVTLTCNPTQRAGPELRPSITGFMTKLSIIGGLLIASGSLLAPASLLAQQYTINTIGGIEASPGWSGDTGPATFAQLNTPIRVALDSKGNIYINDSINESIRVISPSNGLMNSITGNGSPGYSGDGKGSIGAQLSGAHDIAFDSANNLYIADTANARIRIISNGIINTFAGNGTRGVAGTNLGDGGQAKSAQLILPTGVAVDKSGNVYISDIGNATVRKVTPNGIITTIAGTGFLSFGAYSGEGGPATAALLGQPYSLTTDSAGNLYIVDTKLSRLFKIGSDGNIHTVQTNFTAQNCTIDSAGNIYAPVHTNHTVEKILPGGTILWIGGDGVEGWSGDGGPGTSAQMAQPFGVAVDASGNVYVAEATNAIIRELSPVPFSIGAIANAATNQPFGTALAGVGDATIPIAPGEIVTLFGAGLGPASLVLNTPQKNGYYGTSVGGTSVTFAGTPAPIIYASATLVSVVVPYEVNGLSTASVVVTYNGKQAVADSVPVVPTAPGLFTLDSSGSGQALAVNVLDGKVNSSSDPVAAGGYVILYATGEGMTTPTGVDGKPAPSSGTFPMPVSTVTATVGGLPAVVSYAGGAPGFVAGVMQVNLQIPVGVASGSATVLLTTNNLTSPPVTISIQ